MQQSEGDCHPTEKVTLYLLWFVSASVPGDPQLLSLEQPGEKPDHQYHWPLLQGWSPICSAEDTSCVSAAKGDTDGFGGMSSQLYIHYTPADYKVRYHPAFSLPKHVCQQEYLIQVSLPHKLCCGKWQNPLRGSVQLVPQDHFKRLNTCIYKQSVANIRESSVTQKYNVNTACQTNIYLDWCFWLCLNQDLCQCRIITQSQCS